MLFTVLICFLLLSGGPAEAYDEWNTFVTPAKDVQVMLPGAVTSGWGDAEQTKSDKRSGVERYEAVSAGAGFLLSTVPLIGSEDFAEVEKDLHGSVVDGYKELKKECKITFLKERTGKGWSGRMYSVNVTEEEPIKMLIAMDTKKGEVALLYSISGTPDHAVERAVQSFTMDPESIGKKRDERNSRFWSTLFSPKTPTETVGVTFLCLGAILYLVGALWFIGTAFTSHILWGLGTIFLPFVGLVYLTRYWPRAWLPFVIQVGGGILFVIGAISSPHLPD